MRRFTVSVGGHPRLVAANLEDAVALALDGDPTAHVAPLREDELPRARLVERERRYPYHKIRELPLLAAARLAGRSIREEDLDDGRVAYPLRSTARPSTPKEEE